LCCGFAGDSLGSKYTKTLSGISAREGLVEAIALRPLSRR
jgi:hypothetical protein